jgi:hypothetical protein
MQEDVSEESDNDDCEGNSVPYHATATTAINTIKKYISAADGNSDSSDKLYELENQIEIIHKKNCTAFVCEKFTWNQKCLFHGKSLVCKGEVGRPSVLYVVQVTHVV